MTEFAPDDVPFGERLARWLDFLEMKQSTLARGLGVSAPTVHGWLSGRESPRIDRLGAIAVVLKISLAEFFGDLPPPGLVASAALPTVEPQELPPHPRTGDTTREINTAALLRGGGDEAA